MFLSIFLGAAIVDLEKQAAAYRRKFAFASAYEQLTGNTSEIGLLYFIFLTHEGGTWPRTSEVYNSTVNTSTVPLLTSPCVLLSLHKGDYKFADRANQLPRLPGWGGRSESPTVFAQVQR
jgi:hypothetical protein